MREGCYKEYISIVVWHLETRGNVIYKAVVSCPSHHYGLKIKPPFAYKCKLC